MARRPKNKLKRRFDQREPYERVLIVCEGAKTEPNYFEDLRHDQRLASANVVITGETDSDPMSVVEFGVQEFEEDGEYDRLFCVFDRDTHASFDAARQALRSAGKGAYAIVSYPCFEYWILLHFEESASPYDHPDPPCSQVEADVRRHIADYGKGMRGLYETTKPNVNTAIRRSQRRWSQAKSSQSFNPSTAVHRLVGHLLGLRT